MINLNSTTAPQPVTTDETRAFFNLLALVTDPKSSATRVGELYEAAEKAGERERRAKIAESDLAVARERHDEYVRTNLAEHKAKLKSEHTQHDHDCSRAMNEVRIAREEADRLRARATTDAAAAAKLKSELEGRLERLKSVMA